MNRLDYHKISYIRIYHSFFPCLQKKHTYLFGNRLTATLKRRWKVSAGCLIGSKWQLNSRRSLIGSMQSLLTWISPCWSSMRRRDFFFVVCRRKGDKNIHGWLGRVVVATQTFFLRFSMRYLGRWSNLTGYFSNGLKPPTRWMDIWLFFFFSYGMVKNKIYGICWWFCRWLYWWRFILMVDIDYWWI